LGCTQQLPLARPVTAVLPRHIYRPHSITVKLSSSHCNYYVYCSIAAFPITASSFSVYIFHFLLLIHWMFFSNPQREVQDLGRSDRSGVDLSRRWSDHSDGSSSCLLRLPHGLFTCEV